MAMQLSKTSSTLLSVTKPEYSFEDGSLSIYTGELTEENLIKQMLRIKKVFPTLHKDYYSILAERIKENNFTDKKLEDAINFVIDNCVYPQPSIAQFIQFDVKVKTKTYKELLKLLEIDKSIFSKYERIDIESSEPVFALVDDIEKYGLKLYNKEKQKIELDKDDSNGQLEQVFEILKKKGKENIVKVIIDEDI